MSRENKEVRKIIKETIEKVLRQYDVKPLKIILFGSRAKGNYKGDSDWDILIIVENKLSRKDKLLLHAEMTKELAKYFIPCDILIRAPEEIRKFKGWVHSVTKTALKEGIAL